MGTITAIACFNRGMIRKLETNDLKLNLELVISMHTSNLS